MCNYDTEPFIWSLSMPKRTERIVVLLTPDERATIRDTAAARGATVGGFARKAILDQTEQDKHRERLLAAARELLATEPAEV